jgi:flagellar biosynthetic protein FlhB
VTLLLDPAVRAPPRCGGAGAERWLFPEVHLQWFAAEDEGRTEEPTEHKLRKAREEGKVAKSAELAPTLVLLASILVLAASADSFLQSTVDMVKYFISVSVETEIGSGGTAAGAVFVYFVRLSWPVLAAAFVAAILGNLVQVGFLFTAKPITPDFSRIVPHFGQFIRRSLFSVDAAFGLAKSLVKIAIIGTIAYLNVQSEFDNIVGLLGAPFLESTRLISSIAFRIVVESALLMMLLSVLDYLFQRRRHLESLKMSRQEVKEERKQYEGDPLIRSRLRERQRQIMMRNIPAAVRKADVVITNPTHYAVALQYDRLTMVSPQLVAKGADMVALRIRELAREYDVTIVENRPLARELHDNVEVGEFVPERYWNVIAAILGQIRKFRQDLTRAG